MRRLPLRGADLVLMAMHAPWARIGLSSNTMLVVDCDGPIEAERVRRALERLLDFCPWPAARLRRPFPWGKLHWAAGPRAGLACPAVRHRTVATGEELHRELAAELNAGIDPRSEPPVRVLLAECGPGWPRSVLVLTWFHPLMDPRGGQNLLGYLAGLDEGRDPPWGPEPAFAPLPDPRPLRERGRLARQSLAYMQGLSPVPPVSPGRGLVRPGPVRFRRDVFRERDAEPRDMREISWRLAVVGKGIAEVWKRRGLPDVPFLLPISVDLRPKGDPGPVFGNMLAFHFARFRPSDTADLPALARALRQQMANAVRDGQVEANAVAMEFLHYRPVSRMLRALPWTSGGELFSFNCADIGEFPGHLERLFGRGVVNACHVPAVLPRPGIGVFFNRCAGRNNVVVSWVEGAVGEEEVAAVVDAVGEGMGWLRMS